MALTWVRYLLAAMSLLGAMGGAQGQLLNISDILALSPCDDTACVGAFARSKGLCLAYADEKDGYAWVACEGFQGRLTEEQFKGATLGFFGYPISYYNEYSISTSDTAFAGLLTAEIEQHGFQVEEVYPDSRGERYRKNGDPLLEIMRLEKRMFWEGEGKSQTERILWHFKVVRHKPH